MDSVSDNRHMVQRSTISDGAACETWDEDERHPTNDYSTIKFYVMIVRKSVSSYLAKYKRNLITPLRPLIQRKSCLLCLY